MEKKKEKKVFWDKKTKGFMQYYSHSPLEIPTPAGREYQFLSGKCEDIKEVIRSHKSENDIEMNAKTKQKRRRHTMIKKKYKEI